MASEKNVFSTRPAPGVTTGQGLIISHDIAIIREQIAAYRRETGGKVGLVPTMGSFHAGHLSLMRTAVAECGLTVVSLFVNPTQFGPQEDLAGYPRDFAGDMELAAQAGVSLLFSPEADVMYPADNTTMIEVGELGDLLCGRSRAGHFSGVATVVAKLFNIIKPDVAWFGQKDAQQVAVIRRLVADLNFPVEIRTCPTVREPDGLAMSSRNSYLTPEEREQAGSLYQALLLARERVAAGETSALKLRRIMRKSIAQHYLVELEYARVVDPHDMSEIQEVAGDALGVVAAKVGKARLIDNLMFGPAPQGPGQDAGSSPRTQE